MRGEPFARGVCVGVKEQTSAPARSARGAYLDSDRTPARRLIVKDRYREALLRGRIRFVDLEAVLGEELGNAALERVGRLCTRLELRLAMLEYPLRHGPAAELRWFVAETDALRKVRPDASATTRA